MKLLRSHTSCVHLLSGVVFLALFLTAGNSLHAGNYGDIYGASPYANGMGNAVTSFINDSSALYYNPAGLGRVSRGDTLVKLLQDLKKEEGQKKGADKKGHGRWAWLFYGPEEFWDEVTSNPLKHTPQARPEGKHPGELMLAVNYARPRMTSSLLTTEDLANTKDDYTTLGITMNLNNIWDFGRVVRFGLNITAAADGPVMTINDLNPTVHRYLQHGVSNQKPTMSAGLGVELWKDHLFAGVGAFMTLTGSGAMQMKDVPLSNERTTPDQQVIMQMKPTGNPIYGLQFHYGKFMLGVSYRRELELALDEFSARAQTLLLGIQLDLDVAILDHFSPRVWSYGIGYRATENFTLAFDVNRELWSAFRFSRTKDTYSEKLYLNDTTNYRLGAEYKLNPFWSFRMGYTKRPTPLPHMPGANNWMDFDRLITTAGITFNLLPTNKGFLGKLLKNLKSPVVIDLVGEYQKLHGRHVNKYTPTTRNPNYSSGGNIWHAGLSISVFF